MNVTDSGALLFFDKFVFHITSVDMFLKIFVLWYDVFGHSGQALLLAYRMVYLKCSIGL
jgi:hypothetical protein